jgi:hypothetical protein
MQTVLVLFGLLVALVELDRLLGVWLQARAGLSLPGAPAWYTCSGKASLPPIRFR